MDLFIGQNFLELVERFKIDENCKEYLANFKWERGFICLKFKHTKSQIRKDFSRTCNICSHTETAAANTLFHKVKFGLRKAFFISKITTDKWKGYRPLIEDYNITQIKSNKEMYFMALHTMIASPVRAKPSSHQVKSWIRTSYSSVRDFNINRYLDEFCYRINRSQSKDAIFNNLIVKMVESEKIYQSKIICT